MVFTHRRKIIMNLLLVSALQNVPTSTNYYTFHRDWQSGCWGLQRYVVLYFSTNAWEIKYYLTRVRVVNVLRYWELTQRLGSTHSKDCVGLTWSTGPPEQQINAYTDNTSLHTLYQNSVIIEWDASETVQPPPLPPVSPLPPFALVTPKSLIMFTCWVSFFKF